MEWWQTFFDEQYMKLYGVTFPAERTEREVKAVIAALALPPDAHVLDLCCGQGRHAVRLAQEGYHVTGLDLSPQLLALARQSAEVNGVELTLMQGDMRRIPFQGEFDAIVNLFTAFGYFEADDDNAEVLRSATRALKPGGKLLIDMPNIYFNNSQFGGRTWYDAEAGLVFQQYAWDPWTGRDNTTYYWVENGERKSRSFSVRTYTSYEMIKMLRNAGLTPVKLYGGFDLKDYNCRESRRLITIALKEG